MAATADRLTAAEIYERVEENAEDELDRRSTALAFSGLGAGRAAGLDPKITNHLVRLGEQAANHNWLHVFVSGVFGGWLVALVAWLVSAAQRTIGQVVIIWMLTFMLGSAPLVHPHGVISRARST